jgi:hypothetical protein
MFLELPRSLCTIVITHCYLVRDCAPVGTLNSSYCTLSVALMRGTLGRGGEDKYSTCVTSVTYSSLDWIR